MDVSIVSADPALKTEECRMLAAHASLGTFRVLTSCASSGEMQREEGGVSACEASETMDLDGSQRRRNSVELSCITSAVHASENG